MNPSEIHKTISSIIKKGDMKQVKCLKEKFSLRMFSPQNRFFPSAVFWRNSVCDLLILKLFWMLQPTDTILYIELPNISTLLDHTESCLGVFHFNWLAKKFCLISNRANIIGCWVFASSCLGWDMTITSLILRFHDDSLIITFAFTLQFFFVY